MITRRCHWIFDAHSVPIDACLDRAKLRAALSDVAALCDMNIVAGPLVAEGIPENPGLSGLCIVDFSHISIHTFSEPAEVCIDVFSCKEFNPQLIFDYLCTTYGATAENTQFFEVNYPFEQTAVSPLPQMLPVAGVFELGQARRAS